MNTTAFDLNLRHLRALLAIKEHASITTAASIVNLSQPALTQGLAKLERQLGYMLFERRTAGVVLTPMGEIVVERVGAALEHLAFGSRGLTRVFHHPERLMTMTQLRAFLALADAGNFTLAARHAGLSQTAVHRAVGDLEQVVGVMVVERRGRGVWLNEAGRRLARGIRLAAHELTAAMAELGLEGSGQLIAVGALPLARPFLIPNAMARLYAEHPRARFEVLEGSSRELFDPLRDGRIDLIVGAVGLHEVTDLYQEGLYEDRLVITAGKQHPLVGCDMPTVDMLAAYPWIVAPPGTSLRSSWEEMFAAHSPASPVECESVMIIGRLLTEGPFLTLLSPDQVALQIRSGLLATVGTPLEAGTRTVGLTTRRSWRPTSLQRRFIEILREVGQTRAERVETGWL